MERLLFCAAIVLFNNQLLHVSAVLSYPVRLTGGSNVYEGQVEVLYNSATWRTVCTSNWDVNETSVTYRQLGIFTSGDVPTFSNSTVDTDLNAVTITCGSSGYYALGSCSVSSTTSCGSTDRVEVQCSSPPQIPSFSEPSFMINTTTTSISATIHWTVSTGDRSRPAKKYQVICSNVNDGYSLNSTLLDSNTVLYDLKPCALYTCCVGGIDTNGANGAVKCISFRIPFSPIGVSGIPTSLEYLELRSRSVTLLWEQLNTTERCSPPILYSVRVEAQQQQHI